MTSYTGGEPTTAGERLAPVIPLFDQELSDHADVSPIGAAGAGWHPTWQAPTSDSDAESGDAPMPAVSGDDPARGASVAETLLLRRLRVRWLSIAEARTLLAGQGVASEVADDVVDRCVRRGYLDDGVLAEQVVHTSVTRRGEGRQAVRRALVRRGVDREVADAVVTALPDDDADRALEWARCKAPAMTSLPRETALRRLAGQLARRGYGSGVALGAARTALEETDLS